MKHSQQVCNQPVPLAVTMTMLATVADRNAAGYLLQACCAAIDLRCLPVGRPAANLPHTSAVVDRWDRQTDKHCTIT